MFAGIVGQIKNDLATFDVQLWKDWKCISEPKAETKMKTAMAALRILSCGAIVDSVIWTFSAVISGAIITGVIPSLISIIVFRDVFIMLSNIENRLVDGKLMNSVSALGHEAVRTFTRSGSSSQLLDKAKDVVANSGLDSNKDLVIKEAYQNSTTTYCKLINENLILQPIWNIGAQLVVPKVVKKLYKKPAS